MSARCAHGLRVVSDSMDGTSRILTCDIGGSVRFVGNAVEDAYCCLTAQAARRIGG